MDNKTIEKNFQRIRREKGLTWADLERRAGVNNYQSILTSLKNNKSTTIANVEKLAGLLEVDFLDLLKPPAKDEKKPDSIPFIICPHCGERFYISAHKEQTQEEQHPENVSKPPDTLF